MKFVGASSSREFSVCQKPISFCAVAFLEASPEQPQMPSVTRMAIIQVNVALLGITRPCLPSSGMVDILPRNLPPRKPKTSSSYSKAPEGWRTAPRRFVLAGPLVPCASVLECGGWRGTGLTPLSFRQATGPKTDSSVAKAAFALTPHPPHSKTLARQPVSSLNPAVHGLHAGKMLAVAAGRVARFQSWLSPFFN